MRPADLKPEHFAAYAPMARAEALKHLSLLQQLPLSFLASLLRELIEYDFSFPAERFAMDRQLASLSALSPGQREQWLHDFSQLRLTPEQEQSDWVNQPAHFTEAFSAYLWSTHQMDAFRDAATGYSARLSATTKRDSLPVRRLGMAVIGQGVDTYASPLFTNLRRYGTYFSAVDPTNGLDCLLAVAASRSTDHPVPYGHWYVDGGTQAQHGGSLTSVSYASLRPARTALLKDIDRQVSKPGMGPEQLRSHMMQLAPTDLGLGGDALLDRFQLKLLTEGSGTQIFSTTFAQWTAREVLRRAQALTLLVRYAPRQRQRPMNELLSSSPGDAQLDPVGSLIDADMGAYYQWIDQQRLPGAEDSSFLVWFEGHTQAIAVGPSLPRGAESKSKVGMTALVGFLTG